MTIWRYQKWCLYLLHRNTIRDRCVLWSCPIYKSIKILVTSLLPWNFALSSELSPLNPCIVEDVGVNELSALKDFTFMDLYTYLIKSKDKEFDHKSLRTFKLLKAYSYFKDELVRNVWMSPIHNPNQSKNPIKDLPSFADALCGEDHAFCIQAHINSVHLLGCQCHHAVTSCIDAFNALDWTHPHIPH